MKVKHRNKDWIAISGLFGQSGEKYFSFSMSSFLWRNVVLKNSFDFEVKVKDSEALAKIDSILKSAILEWRSRFRSVNQVKKAEKVAKFQASKPGYCTNAFQKGHIRLWFNIKNTYSKSEAVFLSS